MARNFAEADFILWVPRKIIGGRNPDGTQQGFEISDSDWTNTVLPAINGAFHVAGVDELTTIHYWKADNPVGEPVWYLAENQDLRGETALTTNDSSKVDEATVLYETLSPLRTQYKETYDAEQQAALDKANREKYFVDNQIPENLGSLRAMRTQLLKDTDWVMLEDVWETASGMALASVPAAAKEKANWKTYRQRPRDLPAQQADPYEYANFTGWPVNPAHVDFVP